jgi:hypothetical protein
MPFAPQPQGIPGRCRLDDKYRAASADKAMFDDQGTISGSYRVADCRSEPKWRNPNG